MHLSGSHRLSDCDQCAGFLSGSDEVAKVHIYFLKGNDHMGFYHFAKGTSNHAISKFQASKHSHKLNACFCCLNFQFF